MGSIAWLSVRWASDQIFRVMNDLPTPCLIADLPAMERNLSLLQGFLKQKGKALRAHAKTHKSTRIASRQIEAGAIGICAAKLSEAERLARSGIASMLLTGPVVTDEAHDRLLRCLADAPGLAIVLDDLENAHRLSEKLGRENQTLRCLIDLDPGFHRTGVPFDRAIPFAKSLATLPNIEVIGIQAYAGNLQHLATAAERREKSQDVLRAAAKVFKEYQTMGLRMEIFSGGGTGTLAADVEIPELTEIQAGSYLFMDEEYTALEWEEPRFETALFLLATVVSANHRGFVTIDAGLKTLYRDGGIPAVIEPAAAGATYEWFGDEYGKISTAASPEAFPVGRKVRLSLSHVDPTINLFDRIYAVEKGCVAKVFPIDLRGCSQ